MADIIDQAQQLDREFNEKALAANRQRREFDAMLHKETPLVIDGTVVCLDCGDDIPAARIAANPAAVRCVDCQARKERR